MRATTATDFRKNLARELDRVHEDGEPLIIVRTGGKPAAVLIPLEELGSWEETNYLLSTESNRKELMAALAEYEDRKGVVRKLVDE
jgi:antitoxin YefM